MHRLTSGAFGYELTWTPPTGTEAGGRFLAGLTDPTTLAGPPPVTAYDPGPVGPETPPSTYDAEPVGAPGAVVGPWSGAGRPLVGARSAGPDDAENAAGDGRGDDVGDGWGDLLAVAAGGRV